MLWGMYDAIFGQFNKKSTVEGTDYGFYDLYVTWYFRVVLAKFVCAVALHFMLYPHTARSMGVMKFMINHHDHFTNFWIPFSCVIACNIVNIWS